MWRMHLTPPAAVYILYVHQMSGELDCLSNLTSSTALPRARPHTAFTASWASCWPKDTSPWLLKCLRWYKQHLQLPARNLGLFYNGSQDCPALMVLEQIELEPRNDDSGMDPACHAGFLLYFSWSFALYIWTISHSNQLALLILKHCIRDRIPNNPKMPLSAVNVICHLMGDSAQCLTRIS